MRRRRPSELFTVSPAKRGPTMVTKDLSVDQLKILMKTMISMGVFHKIPLANSRTVYGPSGYSWTGGGDTREASRRMFCLSDNSGYTAWNKKEKRYGRFYQPPIWEMEYHFIADQRYIREQVIEEESAENNYMERVDTILINAWYNDGPFHIDVLSIENRSQFEQDMKSLLQGYEAIQNSHRSVATWHDKGLEVGIQCSCGRLVQKNSQKFAKQHENVLDIFALAPALRCLECNAKGGASIIPMYQSGYFAKQRTLVQKQDCNPPPDSEYGPDDIYEAIGGDGMEEVYLSDDVVLTPPSEDGEN